MAQIAPPEVTMRIRQVFGFVAGSVAVYVAVACAASKGDSSSQHNALDAAVDAVRDALGFGDGGPVKDAVADPGTATVDSVPCDRDFPAGSPAAAGGYKWGEKAFPGRSKEDLARGVALFCYSTPLSGSPPGYQCSNGVLYVRDGAVAVQCPTTAIASVTITMPPPL